MIVIYIHELPKWSTANYDKNPILSLKEYREKQEQEHAQFTVGKQRI